MAGLRRVAAGGGSAEAATRLDLAAGDTSHAWPAFLPDGRHFLCFVRSEKDERRGVYLGRLDDSGAGSLLLRSDSNVAYVPVPDAAEGSPDGSRIFFLRHNDDPPPHEIHVVIGWRGLLR
jgi:hypothetical protein